MNIFGNEPRDLHVDLNGKEIYIQKEIFDRIDYMLNDRTTDNIYLLTNRLLNIGFDGVIQSELFVDWRDTHSLSDEIVTNIVSTILTKRIIQTFTIENVVQDDTFLPMYCHGGKLTYMVDIPINTQFHALNHDWYGEILMIDGKKHLTKYGIADPIELTNDMYCWIEQE